jgi:hypothetical protein
MKNLLQSSINEMQSTLSAANISGKESILNGMQLEQVLLKKNIIDRYANRLRSANYLPSAIDHNTNQAINTKTVVKTSSLFADNTDKSLTSRYLIVVGLPSGLLETLRYKSSSLQTGHLYTVRLYFKNIQLTGRTEEQIVESGGTLYASKPYTFSSRLFVSEGAQLFNGADITAPELTSYEQVAKATKFKVFDDQGNYVDITRNQVAGILSSEVATNHLNSHYGKLLLKTTSGISVEEEIFDLVPQVRTYPDAGKIPLYSTLVDLASNKFGVTAEDQLNKERTMRDLARSIQLAPTQHKDSMMVSKTFERIHVIPIDINDIISDPAIQLSRSDISFINIIAEVEYSQFQPAINPVQSSTRTQSFANSLGERGDGLVTSIDIGTFNLQDQSVASVGINKIIETSNNAGGRFGGFRR